MLPEHYLFSEVNTKKKINNCHLAIIGQAFSEVDYWILGDIFNYNFYTSFDAENTPRVGLALQVGAGLGATILPTPIGEPEANKPSIATNAALMNVCVVITVAILLFLVIYVICRCRKSANERASKKRV